MQKLCDADFFRSLFCALICECGYSYDWRSSLCLELQDGLRSIHVFKPELLYLHNLLANLKSIHHGHRDIGHHQSVGAGATL